VDAQPEHGDGADVVRIVVVIVMVLDGRLAAGVHVWNEVSLDEVEDDESDEGPGEAAFAAERLDGTRDEVNQGAGDQESGGEDDELRGVPDGPRLEAADGPDSGHHTEAGESGKE
jgi:hypothetical protein